MSRSNIKYSNLPLSPEEEEEYGNDILYATSFVRNTDTYKFYVAFAWFFICIPCILIYGLGILGLLWIPIIIYIAVEDIKSRKLFITSDSIIYITQPPACIPCLGLNKTEKHVLLSLVTDVVVEKGWYASCWGLENVRIEIAGQGSENAAEPGDLSLLEIGNAKLFKKIVLHAAASKRAGLSLSRDDIDRILKGDKTENIPKLINNNIQMSNNTNPIIPLQTDEKLDKVNETMIRIEQPLVKSQNNDDITVLQ